MSGDYFSISQSDMTQHVPREKLRVQGFDSAPPFQEQEDEGEHHRQQAAYEATGMLSEMFNFSPAALLETSRILPPEWFPGRQEMVTGGDGDCRQQHVSGVNAAAADMQLFLMNPPPPAALQGYDHPAQPGGHSSHFTNSAPGIGGVNVVEGRKLSLSLSPSLHNLEAAEKFREHGGMLLFSQGGGGWGGGGHHHILTGWHDQPAGVGVVNALRNSKYAQAAQELLEEFCGSVGQRGQFTMTGELITPSADQNPTSNNNTTSMSRPPLSSSDGIEHRRRKVKLLSMLDEADKKYGHYRDQMQMVASSFDSIMGIGASKTYTSLAHRAMSRHFRCLKDAIAAQLRHSRELLGEKEEDDDSASVSKGETPRLKILLERSLRQQRAAALVHHQMGHGQQEGCWRPQRGLPERSVNVLRSWLFQHFLHPYPSDAHKKILARQTGLSRSQVSNWFINARVRLWKPMVEDMYQQEAKEEGEESTDSSPNTSAGNHHNNYDDNANTAPPPLPPPPIAAVAPPSSAVVLVTTEMDDDKKCEMNNNDQESGDPSPLLDFEAAGQIIGWSVAAGDGLVRLGTGSSGDISLTLGLRHHENLPGKNAWS